MRNIFLIMGTAGFISSTVVLGLMGFCRSFNTGHIRVVKGLIESYIMGSIRSLKGFCSRYLT